MSGAGEKDRIVGLLADEWAVLNDLLEGLDDAAWALPALPGWTVHDVVSHLIGGERMLLGHDRPAPPDEVDLGDHIRNDIARMNEAWIVALRHQTPAAMRADFRSVTDERLAALRSMSVEEFDAPSWTPTGKGTYGRFMQIRVFDFWMHEQDIRAATGMAGHEDGPVAEESLSEVVGALGYIVGKRAGAPEGSSVTFILTGPLEQSLHVAVDGRAAVVDELPGAPTTELALGSSLFLRLAGGRVDPETVLEQVRISGDAELGRRVATNLAYTI